MSEAPEAAAHAKFSASGAERWLRCPASIDLTTQAPPAKSSIYADEGVQAHACLEQFLKNPKERADTVQALLIKSNPMDMVKHCREAAEEIWGRVPEGAELFSETKALLTFIHQDLWGTYDAAIVEDFGRLQVFDLKYGAGIPVEAEGNAQLAFYALGAAHQFGYNFKDVSIVVIQPRAKHDAGPVREWRLSIAELRQWEKTFRDGVAAALDPLAELKPGDHCRFCPAKPICPAISDRALAQARIAFRPSDPVSTSDGTPAKVQVPLPDVRQVPLPNLAVMLDAAELIEHWIDGLRHHAANVLESGGVVSGWKMVPKLGQRRWKDEGEAAAEAKALWGDRAFTAPELLSPAQLEKATKDKVWVEARVTRESSGLKMMRDSDDRLAVTAAEVDFKGVPLPLETPGLPDMDAIAEQAKQEVGTLIPTLTMTRAEHATFVKSLPAEITHATTKGKSQRKRKDVKPSKPKRAVKPKPAKRAATNKRRRG